MCPLQGIVKPLRVGAKEGAAGFSEGEAGTWVGRRVSNWGWNTIKSGTSDCGGNIRGKAGSKVM